MTRPRIGRKGRTTDGGFSLIEVMFAIAFLASSSAVSTFMLRQDDCFQRTVAASAAMLLVASVGGKLIGTSVAGHVLHWQPGEANLIGWMLQTKALIMIIFANILLDKAVITASTFTALLLMAVGSTMLTIPVVTPMLARLRHLIGKTD
mgnify:CR=1 FL=1